MHRLSLAVLLTMAAALPAQAQHEHGQHTKTPGLKALTAQQVNDYRSGAGMGLARAAELNRYPGPKHVLELADSLQLTDEQRAQTKAIRERIEADAQALGERIIDKETELDALFAGGHADAAAVTVLVADIAELNGRLRAAHLNAHIAMRPLLTPRQIEAYERLRGY